MAQAARVRGVAAAHLGRRQMIHLARTAVRMYGAAGAFHLALRRALGVHASCHRLVRDAVSNRTALEIGGPSPIFGRRGLLPIYPHAARVDNCNYRSRTVWEGTIREGRSFVFNSRREPGQQFFVEATSLERIGVGRYDVVLASHVLEHIANPLKALTEWKRVLKAGGHVVLVLPHREGTFDHRRPVTPMRHLVDDFHASTGEDDTTHVAEVMALHDLGRDPGAGSRAAFEERCRHNFDNRCMHHHVFDTALAGALIDWLGCRIVAIEAALPHHIIVVGRNSEAPPGGNAAMLGTGAPSRARSPFRGDRRRT